MCISVYMCLGIRLFVHMYVSVWSVCLCVYVSVRLCMCVCLFICSLMASRSHDSREAHGTFLAPESRHRTGCRALLLVRSPCGFECVLSASRLSVSQRPCGFVISWPWTFLPPVASLRKNACWGLGLHIVVMAPCIVCTFIKMTHGQEAIGL